MSTPRCRGGRRWRPRSCRARSTPSPAPAGWRTDISNGASRLRPGTRVVVEVPATSANLGPGFDCFGLALDWRDSIILEVTGQGFIADVTGEGAADVPTDERHLIISSARAGLADLGLDVPGLRVRSDNTIP